MPHLNHTGPEGQGSKSGRKLGLCHKTETELLESGVPGIGQAKRMNSGGGAAKGKRLKYTQTKNNQ
jgi:hypothetical protein